ncbi:enoyl-CoA hydratase/isomerase family protein, partial [Nocardia otitidiscaviarum]|uniref:enoyl-CoA hydratase/isomerase family protein n=1 Tax=Nocardia otitidiscaviarum TaxID=1823 RepID=UPI0024580144
MSSDLHVDVSGGVAVLTLNRPAQQNALTPAMAAELGAALRRCDTEDAIGAVVITGTRGAGGGGGGAGGPRRGGGGAPAPPPRARAPPPGRP